jgi:hypothetical protein
VERFIVDLVLPILLTLALIGAFRLYKGAPLTSHEVEQIGHVFGDGD